MSDIFFAPSEKGCFPLNSDTDKKDIQKTTPYTDTKHGVFRTPAYPPLGIFSKYRPQPAFERTENLRFHLSRHSLFAIII